MNLKITLSGQPGYLANLGLVWYCVHNGLMDPALGWPIALALIFTIMGFYLVIRLGWSRRLRDPSLTVPQMLSAALLSAVGYVAAPPVHIALLMPVAVTLAFSVFSLKGRQVVVVQTFTTLLFCLTSAVMCYLQPEFYRPEVEILVMGVLVSAVLMLTWSGSQVAALRSRQRRQREELTQMLARIEELAARDALTGLPNRRHMSTLLAHHVERAQRNGQPLTIAILDLDHFKNVNDTHGHGAGDEVLQAFARTAQAALSGAETIARWGGEEFLLLSTATPQSVVALLDLIRHQLEGRQVSAQAPALRVSFSAGVTAYHGKEAIAHTIDRADLALYEAKAAGRACTKTAEQAMSTQPLEAPSLDAVTVSPLPEALKESSLPLGRPQVTTGTTDTNQTTAPPTEDSTDPKTASQVRFAWLLGTELKQRRWVSRTLISSAAYVVGLASVGFGAKVGLVATAHAQLLAIALLLTPVLMFSFVRSGLTSRLADPAITMVQILTATTWACVLYATTSHAHAAQLTALVMVITIGVVNLKRRQAWLACAYAIVSMSATIAAMTHLQPLVYVPTVQFTHWILLVIDLPVLMLMGIQLSKLHARLRVQREQLKDAVSRLHELATHDELTGLNNRNHMNEMLAHYKRRHEECGETFSVALIDLDHFKRINDSHGHAVGDEVLKAFARRASETLRQIDQIARWGGEEFLVLCPQTTPDQALIGLERLRQAFADAMISSTVPELRASFSVGLTAPDKGDESIEGTIARADAALYVAKHAGRNCTCLQKPEVNECLTFKAGQVSTSR
jgi:diguanylate cyclase